MSAFRKNEPVDIDSLLDQLAKNELEIESLKNARPNWFVRTFGSQRILAMAALTAIGIVVSFLLCFTISQDEAQITGCYVSVGEDRVYLKGRRPWRSDVTITDAADVWTAIAVADRLGCKVDAGFKPVKK